LRVESNAHVLWFNDCYTQAVFDSSINSGYFKELSTLNYQPCIYILLIVYKSSLAGGVRGARAAARRGDRPRLHKRVRHLVRPCSSGTPEASRTAKQFLSYHP